MRIKTFIKTISINHKFSKMKNTSLKMQQNLKMLKRQNNRTSWPGKSD